MTPDEFGREQQSRTELLSRKLLERGFSVAPLLAGGITVRNVAGASDAAVRYPAMLRQEVTCLAYESGMLWWFWVWRGADGAETPDLEPMCPAADVDGAAARIAHVLALPSSGEGAVR